MIAYKCITERVKINFREKTRKGKLMNSFIKSLRRVGLTVVTFTLLTLLNVQTNARQPVDGGGGGGGGGGSSLGYWANYGTVTQWVPCVTVTWTIEIIAGVPTWVSTTTIVLKPVFYQKEICDPGGSECTLGTIRLTYQGGGC